MRWQGAAFPAFILACYSVVEPHDWAGIGSMDLRVFSHFVEIPFGNFGDLRHVRAPKVPIVDLFAERYDTAALLGERTPRHRRRSQRYATEHECSRDVPGAAAVIKGRT